MKPIFFLAVTLIITSCIANKSLFAPAETDVQKADAAGIHTDFASLQKGFKLYKENCSGCHKLYLPDEHTVDNWNSILPEMYSRTSLTSEEQILVKYYILSRHS